MHLIISHVRQQGSGTFVSVVIVQVPPETGSLVTMFDFLSGNSVNFLCMQISVATTMLD
jgi:hypothetical protein